MTLKGGENLGRADKKNSEHPQRGNAHSNGEAKRGLHLGLIEAGLSAEKVEIVHCLTSQFAHVGGVPALSIEETRLRFEPLSLFPMGKRQKMLLLKQ